MVSILKLNNMNTEIDMNSNKLVAFLQKSPSDFTQNDIINYIKANGVHHLNFMYPGGDGRLKTLNFFINNLSYLKEILTFGERVDGSSLFPFIKAESSDMYVVPRYRTAFLDPFAELPTVCLLCSFFDKDGLPMESSSEYTLDKACKEFHKVTGMDFQAMGELEYYVISDDDGSFHAEDQHGYHESAPFVKFGEFRQMCMQYIAMTGGEIKYGHSEVGNFTLDNKIYEQNEIEFLPTPARDAADQIVLAKWVIRNLAYEYGYNATFAPKITVGKAGSGLHIHMRIMKDGKNMMLTNGVLSDVARKAIAGLMDVAPAITAFGNINPTSYYRLVPNQEAPTKICWGDRNRSVLVRVPLGWTGKNDMCCKANPNEPITKKSNAGQKQTVEIRSSDSSSDIYLLIASLAVACRHGFEMKDALEFTKRTYVDVNIHKEENKSLSDSLENLPKSCMESADKLISKRSIFEEHNVFDSYMIDGIIKLLKSYKINSDSSEKIADEVEKFFYAG